MAPPAFHERDVPALDQDLRRVARALVADDHEAADLAQDVWLRALRSDAEVRDPRRWLSTIARNRSHARRASERSRRSRERTAARPEADATAAPASDDSLGDLLRREVEALGEPAGTVVRLRYLEGLETAEVAARLDRNESTVRSQLRRGVARLRERLDERFGGDRAAWAAPLLACLVRERPVRTWRRLAGIAAAVAAAVALPLLLRGAADPVEAAPSPRADAFAAGPARPEEPAHGASLAARVPAAVEPPPPAAAPEAALEVRVVDGADRPLPGATVRVWGSDEDGPWRRASTDADGRVRVPVPAGFDRWFERAGRKLGVAAAHPGLADSWVHLVEVPRHGERALTVRLDQPEATYAGEVVDGAGRPVAGARVVVVSAPQLLEDAAGLPMTRLHARAVTDADGRYTVAGLDTGPDQVREVLFVHDAYVPVVAVWALPAPGAYEGRTVLRRGAAVVGVARLPDGRPAAGARVRTLQGAVYPELEREAVADDDGAFRLRGVFPGDNLLQAELDGPDGVQFARGLVRAGRDGEVAWDPVLAERDGLALRFVDGSGAPLPRVRAYLFDHHPGTRWVLEVVADDDGAIDVRRLPPGGVDLTVAEEGLEGRVLARHRDLRPAPDVRELVADPGPPGHLVGTLPEVEGRPWAGGVVALVPPGQTAPESLDVDPRTGRFEWPDLLPGEYRAFAYAPELGGTSLGTWTVAAGAQDRGAVALPATGRLRLAWRTEPRPYEFSVFYRLTDWDGNEGAFGANILERASSRSEDVTLLPGRYVLSVFEDEQLRLCRYVDVESGGVTEVDVTF